MTFVSYAGYAILGIGIVVTLLLCYFYNRRWKVVENRGNYHYLKSKMVWRSRYDSNGVSIKSIK